jgi:hypothetical protein
MHCFSMNCGLLFYSEFYAVFFLFHLIWFFYDNSCIFVGVNDNPMTKKKKTYPDTSMTYICVPLYFQSNFRLQHNMLLRYIL